MSFHVFLSHSTADKPAVEELPRRLAKKGIQALVGQMAFDSGQSLAMRCRKGSGGI
jgi:hypothetical protein